MTCVAAWIRRLFLCALLLPWAWTAAGQVQPLNVCAVGFHNHEELAAFRAQLPGNEFDLLDFSAELLGAQNTPSEELAASSGSRHQAADPALSQLLALCASDLRCDVWVYSGEFAGEFFGRYGSSLSLQSLEEAACQQRCQSLFQRAQEVFLLACNTLASKDPDIRTPNEYLQVLLEHGFDRASAERVVQLRYGSSGPSFGQAFLRIFAGVPRIYGFSSVAPNGVETASRLRRYFRTIGDYRRHLDSTVGSTDPNTQLLAAFRGTSLVQMSALPSSDQQAAERELVCGIYDDTRTLEDRLRIIQRLLARSDFLAFLPTIKLFLRRHPPEHFVGEARHILAEMHEDAAARDRVVGYVRALYPSTLQLELANVARCLGWISAEEFRRLAIDVARQLIVPPLSAEGVDVICETSERQPIGDQFRSEDLPEALFHDAQGLRLVACLAPPDERVSLRLAGGLESADVWARRWAAFGLSRRLPLNDAVLKRLAPHVDDPSPDVRERVRSILNAQHPVR